MTVDYLETAKAHIARIDGNHSVEFIQTMALASIANALIAIAEILKEGGKRWPS